MAPRLPRERTLIVVLGALSAFGPLSLDMYLPGLPDLAGDLGSSASAAQLTLTACMIGLAAGQLLAGPLSDGRGRRRPLLAGLALYALASTLCALAPSIWLLIPLRLLQGAAGAFGIAISRAVVRDLHSGAAAARVYALLMLVNGLAPIVAPLLGGQLLGVTDWRGIFWLLALIGIALLLVAWRLLPETLPRERRHGGGLAATMALFGTLLRDRAFVAVTLASGLSSAMMFCYIAGSPFVVQEIYGLSPQLFSLAFAANALGIVLLAQVGARLVGRHGPRALMRTGLLIGFAGALLLLLAVVLDAGLALVLAAFFTFVASIGLTTPNAAALALADHPRAAGSASGLLGLAQFAIGGAAAPLVGIGGSGTALPLALVVCALGAASLLAFAWPGARLRGTGAARLR
ncbi:multidrug effflux MFS transporter [Conexibacter stalactiti]|uniref:Multidrug effflux MFS transporter n=1 Tax=Conexibacter stalactiti TaxID=1940611 RepID=A0ABU4HXR3_9ACTN|nr:multidrug effflux MFS transporter [Conexibacter stalactiti]MDW5597260.1 multidrug effflux MFS transporter [Conexibacter stalactiti]MEC5037902.1 multidrug effflux MFS transporter [Conexibacter stalactiti]